MLRWGTMETGEYCGQKVSKMSSHFYSTQRLHYISKMTRGYFIFEYIITGTFNSNFSIFQNNCTNI